MSRDRKGQPLNRLAELTKKTAKHAGVPREVAAHIISAFIDVLVDEVVTTGGAAIPGVVTFSTKDSKKSEKSSFSRYGLKKRHDVELQTKASPILQALHKMHTSFCADGERIVTPSTWRGFSDRYGEILRKNNFANGTVEVNRVRKSDATPNSADNNDFIEVDTPISVDYFQRLTEQMNSIGVFDVVYHKDEREDLMHGRNRLLQLSDVTEETYPYIRDEKIERAARLFELRDKGLIDGSYLDNIGTDNITRGNYSKKS